MPSAYQIPVNDHKSFRKLNFWPWGHWDSNSFKIFSRHIWNSHVTAFSMYHIHKLVFQPCLPTWQHDIPHQPVKVMSVSKPFHLHHREEQQSARFLSLIINRHLTSWCSMKELLYTSMAANTCVTEHIRNIDAYGFKRQYVNRNCRLNTCLNHI